MPVLLDRIWNLEHGTGIDVPQEPPFPGNGGRRFSASWSRGVHESVDGIGPGRGTTTPTSPCSSRFFERLHQSVRGRGPDACLMGVSRAKRIAPRGTRCRSGGFGSNAFGADSRRFRHAVASGGQRENGRQWTALRGCRRARALPEEHREACALLYSASAGKCGVKVTRQGHQRRSC